MTLGEAMTRGLPARLSEKAVRVIYDIPHPPDYNPTQAAPSSRPPPLIRDPSPTRPPTTRPRPPPASQPVAGPSRPRPRPQIIPPSPYNNPDSPNPLRRSSRLARPEVTIPPPPTGTTPEMSTSPQATPQPPPPTSSFPPSYPTSRPQRREPTPAETRFENARNELFRAESQVREIEAAQRRLTPFPTNFRETARREIEEMNQLAREYEEALAYFRYVRNEYRDAMQELRQPSPANFSPPTHLLRPTPSSSSLRPTPAFPQASSSRPSQPPPRQPPPSRPLVRIPEREHSSSDDDDDNNDDDDDDDDHREEGYPPVTPGDDYGDDDDGYYDEENSHRNYIYDPRR